MIKNLNQQITTKAQQLITVCLKLELKIGSCESFTGGGFADVITNCQGASKVFQGAIVSYTNQVKVGILKIDPSILINQGAISAEIAKQMADNSVDLLGADLCVAFTGNADRDVVENKPAFFSFIGLSFHHQTTVFPFQLPDTPDLTREIFKKAAIDFALDKILELLT